MSRTAWLILISICSMFVSGCQSTGPRLSSLKTKQGLSVPDDAFQPLSRLKIQKASMNVEVADPEKSGTKAETLTVSAGGYVESSIADEQDGVTLTLRVPQQECDRLLHEFGRLGKLKSKEVSAEDVTEELVDVQARLENLRATRDRLRLQLEKTNNVEEVLAVERELTRVQAELESLEARLKVMNDKVAFSTLTLSLERKVIYGPVGYVGKTMWWGFEKLFVLN